MLMLMGHGSVSCHWRTSLSVFAGPGHGAEPEGVACLLMAAPVFGAEEQGAAWLSYAAS